MALTNEHAIATSLWISNVPKHLHDGLLRYIAHHIKPGGFLCAVLDNDLRDAFARADEDSSAGLHDLVVWLSTEAPGDCWGSPAKVQNWLDQDRIVAHAEPD